MTGNGMIKKIVSVLFAVFMLFGLVVSAGFDSVSDRLYNRLIDINGYMAKLLDIHGLYSDMGMYITDDKYIVSAAPYTATDYEVKETVALKDFLEDHGVNLLYVNEPAKYTDDDLLREEFGIASYSNRNMDVFIKRIREAGVNAIDLRDNIRDEGLSVYDMFYRTDHHWRVPAGLWASRIMADGLNRYCGYDIDTSVYDEDHFIKSYWKECWLGEQGRKAGRTYVGLDDFTELKPDHDTSFTFVKEDGSTFEGTFDTFVNEGIYDTENDVYENDSWHYSYIMVPGCINNDVEKGKVLILGDSYDNVTQPFLALQIHEVDTLVLRRYDDSFNLRDYIIDNGYDTVIIAYAQFMVGAHDDPSSDNYGMFAFSGR